MYILCLLHHNFSFIAAFSDRRLSRKFDWVSKHSMAWVNRKSNNSVEGVCVWITWKFQVYTRFRAKPCKINTIKSNLQIYSWAKYSPKAVVLGCILTCIWGHDASNVGSSSSGSNSAPAGLDDGGNDRNVFTANCSAKWKYFQYLFAG